MIDEFDLSVLEKWWLHSRGGRGAEDVFLDEHKQKYIWMSNGYGRMQKVYVPENLLIKNEMNYHG